MSDQSQEQGDPALLSRNRLFLIFALLLVELGVFLVGLLVPASEATRQALANQTSSQFGEAANGTTIQLVGFIFVHNLSIAAIEMIPIAGALLFVFSIYSTGLAAQALVSSQGLPVQWGAAIFAFPYSLVELSAYAVAVVSGTMLIVAWRRGKMRQELKIFGLEGAAMVAILLAAAAMEAVTIRVSFLIGFAFWLPTGLALAVLIVLANRRPR